MKNLNSSYDRVDLIPKDQKDKNVYNVLHDININIKPGQFVSIIGKVGSGKSSLLKSIIGLMFNEGEI